MKLAEIPASMAYVMYEVRCGKKAGSETTCWKKRIVLSRLAGEVSSARVLSFKKGDSKFIAACGGADLLT